MEGKELMGNDRVRLKYQVKPTDQLVQYGREIPVVIRPSRKQKIKVINK